MSILTETQIVYSSAIDIDGVLYTQHIIIKKYYLVTILNKSYQI